MATKQHIAYAAGGILTECGRMPNVELPHGGEAIRRAHDAGILCQACRRNYDPILRAVDCP